MTGAAGRGLPAAELAALAALEADRWRSFQDAQREADTLFAQYQLSQLLASGAGVTELASAVLDELLRHDDAQAGALWLTPPGGGALRLLASAGDRVASRYAPAGPRPDRFALATDVPTQFRSGDAAAEWCRAAGWWGVALQESRDTGDAFEQRTVGFVGLVLPAGAGPGAGPRFLSRVRHELAIAFRAAQLRETLVNERSLLSAILDAATDAIVAVDADRNVVRLNRAALALLDLAQDAPAGTCRDVLGCGRPRADGAGHSLRCGARCALSEVLDGAPSIVGREQTVVGAGGAEVPVSASYARMTGPDGGAVAVIRDLRAARGMEELRASFVAAVSHDLRTPLALITAYVDTLIGLDLDDAARRKAVEGIGNAAGRLTALVNEILDVAHLENDRIALRREPSSLPAIVARVVAEFGDVPGIPPIDVELVPDLPLVDVDADRIAQVLDNLVSNASKYGAAPIAIRAAQRDHVVVVSVEDAGIGIDEGEREAVFRRFYRGREVRAGNAPGTGLGLYVCRRLVEAHGGEIWIDDRPRGTSVSFTLPAIPAPRTRRGRTASWSVADG